ncbi:MAG: DUF2924 domain-containing protein [Rhodospirillaceae bacterium]|nr:DUF2924 domain-containing protein [Rhodospirillaceae bacterium]MBL6942013.1 DUF2924 domain-containing protein [Rhodospirillales bacterium]
MNLSVMAQVAALPDKPTDELKRMWQDLFETKAPPYNRSFLVKRLGYRLQELAFGGVSEKTEERLDAMANDPACADPARMKRKAGFRPIAGTRLIREWKGVEHQVTVLDDGFEYQGCKYKSLSVIARTITGTRWSGPVFFGLRKPGSGQ